MFALPSGADSSDNIDGVEMEEANQEVSVVEREELSTECFDPVEVEIARLRRNMAMTPLERLERHNRLASQLRLLRDAAERHRLSRNS
jgi:hypothetical protein